MAWDVEGTKRRVREAAVAEFAEHGPVATTIDRIAVRAGVNRERVYNYFTDKPTLFATVVREQLELIAKAVPLTINSLDDVAAFAVNTFDYQHRHPDLARLVLWEGLYDDGHVADELARSQIYAEKVAQMAQAQHRGVVTDAVDPAYLVFLLISLSSFWSAAPQVARMTTGRRADARGEQGRRRAALIHVATAMARPATAGEGVVTPLAQTQP